MKRQRWDMPKDVQDRLRGRGLHDEYKSRPDYQQNDYIGWIEQAKRSATRDRRIEQMLEELEAGDVYMKMPWRVSKKKTIKSSKPSTFAEFAKTSSSKLAKIITKLDKCLMDAHSEYVCKSAWAGWAYKLGSNYSCLIVLYKDHVKLMIWRGVMLNDPKNLLTGSGINTRHIRIDKDEDIDCVYLNKLLSQQKDIFDSGVKYED